jgi:hypothetical protein
MPHRDRHSILSAAREAYAAAGPGVRTNYNLQDAAATTSSGFSCAK